MLQLKSVWKAKRFRKILRQTDERQIGNYYAKFQITKTIRRGETNERKNAARNISSQPYIFSMTALEIVNILHPFQEYLIQLQKLESAEQPHYEWDYYLSLSYTFIILKIVRGAKDDSEKVLYIEITFRIENNQIIFSEIYHADGINTQYLTDEIRSNKKLHKSSLDVSQEQKIDLTDETINYLSIADRISQHGVNIYSGDSYWPGNYSNVKITSDVITLEQVNHMNSRSLNHKENFSLRDLVFQIPLQKVVGLKQSYDDVLIGTMLVHFFDHSSKNNRVAGDAIDEQIKREYELFD